MRALFTRSVLRREFPNSGFKEIVNAEKLEEESWAWYKPGLFYPVRIGEVFESQYQVLGKLGYGTRSTAWLCRDLKGHKYVTLKVCERDFQAARRELAAYNYLNTIVTRNPGALLVRELLGSFKIIALAGEYQCLIHEPLGMSMETLRQLSPGKMLSETILKMFLVRLLKALDFLHTDAGMVHADLQARNIHLKIEEDSIFKEFEAAELRSPSARKLDGERVIYESRGLKSPKKHGPPVLCDFGEARFGNDMHTDPIQPYVYRAPEIILDIPWTYSADIWNLGVIIWDIFEHEHLFNARDHNGERSNLHHMAEMIGVLGLPPLSFLQRSEASWRYFDNSGRWKGEIDIPNLGLEDYEEQLRDDNKTSFLDFMRKSLQWVPENRQTARQLLNHPWLSK